MEYVKDMFAGGPVVIVLAGFALGLLFWFIGVYVVRGVKLRHQLKALAHTLGGFTQSPRPDLRAALEKAFRRTRCEHAWSEFGETLHDQYDTAGGERQVRDVRATAPAENFLNAEAIVDPWLGSDFFRHLPGILTGLGIIGTFYGLIRGLMAFDPGVDAEKLKLSLGGLFTNVMDAFMFSMSAIALAMLITLMEKWIYASCIHWLGQVTNNLDSLFRSGLGEEYLSNLVHASQDNATQTRQLKESLVTDLKELLTDLTERQIKATGAMSRVLEHRIESSLQVPLTALAETMREVSTQQTTAASTTLESLMRAFIDQMQETVGKQLGGLDDMLQASTQTLGQVTATVRSLMTDMQHASAESAAETQRAVQSLMQQVAAHQQQQADSSAAGMDGMLARMQASFESIAEQQRNQRKESAEGVTALAQSMEQVTTALYSVVTDMQHTSAESTAETQRAVQLLMQQVTAHQQQQADRSAAGVDGMLSKMQASFDSIAEQERSQREKSEKGITALVGSMETRVNQLTESNHQTQLQGAELMRAISEVSTDAITGIGKGAQAITDSLHGVAQLMERLEGLTGQMGAIEAAFGDSARRLTESSAAVGSATRSLGVTTESLSVAARNFEKLGSAVEAEAEARSSLLVDLRTLTAQSRSTGELLAGLTDTVHEKLDESLDRFGNAVTRTLDQNLTAYNKQLSDAVHTLSEAYNELAESLDVQATP